MATLKDVAKLACVDVSTVSRALNNTSYVHPDTKARIFAAVKELSYTVNSNEYTPGTGSYDVSYVNNGGIRTGTITVTNSEKKNQGTRPAVRKST